MLPLLLCQVLFGAIIAFGPTINHANRVAGLASVAVSIIVSSATASISTNRELKLGILALVTTVLALFALPYTDGQVLRNPVAVAGAPLMATTADARLLSPHILGLAAGAPALLLISLVFHPAHRSWLRALWLLGAIVGLGIIGLSDSRDAAIAAASGVLALSASFYIKRRGVLVLICGLLILVAGLGTLFISAIDANLRVRGELWVLALQFLSDNPAFGLGYGGLSSIYHRALPTIGTNAHNLWIQTAADFGAIGLIALMLTAVFSVRISVVDTRVSPALFRGFVATATFLGVAGMAESIVDMTQRYAFADVTIVVPLLFVVLAMPLLRRCGR